MQGYNVKSYTGPVKRYCRTMDLKDDPQLIEEYKLRHSQGMVWPEILQQMRQVGILEMEIYILDNRLFMIVETPLDFDWDAAMAQLAAMPRQQEWERFMAKFQDCDAEASATDKWRMMERMFHIYD